MASKKVRLPSAKLVEDSFNDVDERSEATFATERTSGLISDVFETDQGKFFLTPISNRAYVKIQFKFVVRV